MMHAYAQMHGAPHLLLVSPRPRVWLCTLQTMAVISMQRVCVCVWLWLWLWLWLCVCVCLSVFLCGCVSVFVRVHNYRYVTSMHRPAADCHACVCVRACCLQDGVHKATREGITYTKDEIKLMKTQDLSYIIIRQTQEREVNNHAGLGHCSEGAPTHAHAKKHTRADFTRLTRLDAAS